MNIEILIQVVSLFAVLGVGLFARWRNIVKEETIPGLASLVANVTVPALCVTAFQQTADRSIVWEVIGMGGLAAMLMVLSLGVGLLCYGRMKMPARAAYLHLCTFSNAAFMGYPVMMAVYGELGLLYGTGYTVGFNILFWTIGVALYRGREGMSIKKALLTPGLLFSIIGAVLFAAGIVLPRPILVPMQMVGNLTTPLSMLLIGARLFGLKKSHLTDLRLYGAAALRLIALPLAGFGFLWLAGIRGIMLGICFIALCMPGGTLSGVLAEQYGDASLASRLISLTTALSVATIPLMLFLVL